MTDTEMGARVKSRSFLLLLSLLILVYFGPVDGRAWAEGLALLALPSMAVLNMWASISILLLLKGGRLSAKDLADNYPKPTTSEFCILLGANLTIIGALFISGWSWVCCLWFADMAHGRVFSVWVDTLRVPK